MQVHCQIQRSAAKVGSVVEDVKEDFSKRRNSKWPA